MSPLFELSSVVSKGSHVDLSRGRRPWLEQQVENLRKSGYPLNGAIRALGRNASLETLCLMQPA